MKLASVLTGQGAAVGLIEGGNFINLTAAWSELDRTSGLRAPSTVQNLIERNADTILAAARSVAASRLEEFSTPLSDANLAAPLPNPPKVLCAASNYAAHLEEAGLTVPLDRDRTTPRLFLKPSTTVVGPNAPIPFPDQGQAIDWEVELAAVIGRRGRYIHPTAALDYVFGYTILNDISERRFKAPPDRQPREWDRFFDWLHGKWFDGFAPTGPWVVTADEIPDPQALTIELRVNGEVRQRGSTARMIYGVTDLIAFASSIMTLVPGDIIATGTPEGVGNPRGLFLRPGDLVECEVEGIGVLRNPVTAPAATPAR